VAKLSAGEAGLESTFLDETTTRARVKRTREARVEPEKLLNFLKFFFPKKTFLLEPAGFLLF
jgi:hypothetical protein